MTVLGIDPGFTRLGFGAINVKKDIELLTYGMISHPRDVSVSFGDHFTAGIEQIATDLPRVIGMCHPDLIAMERVPVGRLGSNDALVIAAWTTVKVIAFQFGIPVLDLGASTIKEYTTGDGRATKAKVRNAMLDQFPKLGIRHAKLKKEQKESGEKPQGLPQDVFDGIATAICGAGKYERDENVQEVQEDESN